MKTEQNYACAYSVILAKILHRYTWMDSSFCRIC